MRVYAQSSPELEQETVGAPPAALGGPWDPGPSAPADFKWRATPNMPKFLDDMNDAELVKYLDTLVYDRSAENSQLALFDCRKKVAGVEVGCAKKEKVPLYIQPEIGMNGREIETIDTVRFGLVVARIINYDQNSHFMKARPIPEATHGWWVVDTVGGKLRSRIIIRTYKFAKPVKVLVDNLPYGKCPDHPPGDKDRPAMARWWSCKVHALYSKAEEPARPEANASPFQLVAYHPFANAVPFPAGTQDVATDGSGWSDCGMGCCSTNP